MASLIRFTNDFTLAEESAQEAFEAALEQWPRSGVPEHPRAWLVQTARHLALSRIRRKRVLAEKLESYATTLEEMTEPSAPGEIPDDRLRLIFTCCHPALAPEAQVALTLRTLLGLETDEIARAFVVTPTTMAQRLVRAKRKIADAGISYEVPERSEMPGRLHAVLTVVYLVFTEGYAATRGAEMVRTDLCAEAVRLGRLVRSLTSPDPPAEVTGILALMLLHDARREARLDEHGDLILLEDQDRALWNRAQIDEALALVDQALGGEAGPFTLQAAISAAHCRAERSQDTNWAEIVRIYGELERIQPSPIVTLNRAVAVAMTDGPSAALEIVDALAAQGELDGYHLLHAARGDFLRRLGAFDDAERSYLRALERVGNDSERRFLERRVHEVKSSARGDAP